MGVISLPKTVTRQHSGCDLNPGPSARESSTLTTRLRSHSHILIGACNRNLPMVTMTTVYPQFLHSVADTGWGRLAQRITFCQELDLENEVSPTVAQPHGTLFLPTSTTLLTPVHSENDSRVYFTIMLTTDYCWRSWTCRIAARYKFHVDWLIAWLAPNDGFSQTFYAASHALHTV